MKATIETKAGRLLVALGAAQRIRVLVAEVTGPAREVCRRHQLQQGAILLAAEGMVMAALLAAHTKEEERQVFQLQGFKKDDEPLFKLQAEISGNGVIRARLDPPDLPLQQQLTGLVTVQKILDGREVYRGHAAIRGERLEAALERYLVMSQQTAGKVRIHASLSEEGQLISVCGVLLERLPDMPEEEFLSLDLPETDTEQGQEFFEELITGIAFGQLLGEPLEVLGWQDLLFGCTCSKEKVQGMLVALGPAELRSLALEQGQAEVSCHFCNEHWRVSGRELLAMAQELESQLLH
jgi:molecular chaperone Hsp33